ncbi:hypothetical protein BB561_005744, partial [Smittium simulii]
LIKRPPNTPIPKARAIGATLAATSGVPVENIVSHAFWSNYSMFDTYYRLDRSTQSNMTEAAGDKFGINPHSIAVFAVALSTGLASIYPLRASTAVNFFFFDSDIGKGHKKSTAHSSNIPEISEHPLWSPKPYSNPFIHRDKS